MFRKTLVKLLVLVVLLNLGHAVLHRLFVLLDPARFILDHLCQDILENEYEVEGGECDHVHHIVVEGGLGSQLRRCEDDDVDANEDAKIGDELEQVHEDADVFDRGRVILLLVLTHVSQLD